MDPQTSTQADTKSAPTTTITAEPPTPPNPQHVESNAILQLASQPPLPPVVQDQAANSTTLIATGQVPIETDDIINTAPPPAYMNVDPQATAIPAPAAQRSVLVHPTAAQKPDNYVIELQNLGELPDYVDCPHCHSRQKTTVQKNGNSQQGMAACLCCLFCGIIGAIIPLCFNWCADIDHVCPRCHKMVAHMPYEGKMEPVLPNSGPAFKPSQFQPPAAPPK